MTEAKRPNPGSWEAIKAGCICAVMDNNHGRRAPYPPDGWWVTSGCPLHDDRKTAVIAKVAPQGYDA
jgi:hypothetical protein